MKEDEKERTMAWMIWLDGSSNQRAKGVRVLLRSPEGDTIECAIRLQFSITNNEAEYEMVLSGLDLAKVVGVLSAVYIVIQRLLSDTSMAITRQKGNR